MRVLFVQFGDYREAFHNLQDSGKETYYAQKYTVDWVGKLAQTIEYVGVLCLDQTDYYEKLSNDVHAIAFKNFLKDPALLLEIIEKEFPTHLITCTPYHPILKWAIKSKTKTLPLLADSFEQRDFRSWYRHIRLKRLLNNSHFDFVANHNMNACLSLKRIGVMEQKILPWDFPPLLTPETFQNKTFPKTTVKKLLYVGSMTEKKGVSEALLALSHLKKRDQTYHLTLIGGGDLEFFHNKVEELKLEKETTILGRQPHDVALREMVLADAVLVPSRHEYPEGLPLTIYEGLCTRTPLILSDHPMFVNKIIPKVSGLLFKGSDAEDLADKIEELFSDPGLYEALSNYSEKAWLSLQIPLKWNVLIEKWLSNSVEDHQYLLQYNLESSTKKII